MRQQLIRYTIFLAGASALAFAFPGQQAPPVPKAAPVPVAMPLPKFEVHFSPRGGCDEMWVREINRAEQGDTIACGFYNFTEQTIASALEAAVQRGVSVSVVSDWKASQQTKQKTVLKEMSKRGVKVATDKHHQIFHDKFCVLSLHGDVSLLTGSYNPSESGRDKNAENALAIRSEPELTKAYRDNLALHLAHSEPLK